MPNCGVSFVVQCSITETLTWSLDSGRTRLRITRARALFNREPFRKKGKLTEKVHEARVPERSPHLYCKVGGEGQTRISGTIEIE